MIKTAKPREVIRALIKIGFKMVTGKKERKFIYTHPDGSVTYTVLVPKSEDEFKKGTFHGIRDQTRLDKKSFENAIKCPFKYEDYVSFVETIK